LRKIICRPIGPTFSHYYTEAVGLQHLKHYTHGIKTKTQITHSQGSLLLFDT